MYRYNLIMCNYYFEINKINIKYDSVSFCIRICNDVCIVVIFVDRFWKLLVILFSLLVFVVVRIGIYLIYLC